MHICKDAYRQWQAQVAGYPPGREPQYSDFTECLRLWVDSDRERVRRSARRLLNERQGDLDARTWFDRFYEISYDFSHPQFLTELFIETLRDDIKHQILRMSDPPNTLNEAKTMALRLEAIANRERKQTGSKRYRSRKHAKKSFRKRLCFECGKAGHRGRTCRQ
ncbi:hypothetical protein BDV18DRAFT_143992 [Aspergillus unguis]